MPPNSAARRDGAGRDPEFAAAGAAQAGDVGAVLLDAFADDPFMRWMFPETGRYEAGFPRLAAAYAGRSLGAGSAFLRRDGQAAALWLPPGTGPSVPRLIGAAATGVRVGRWPTLARVLAAMLRAAPAEPHWRLAMIGVRAGARGAGVGSSLLARTLAHCDADGAAAYLEATSLRNVALYERHGFRRLPEIRIGAAPPLVPMLRAGR